MKVSNKLINTARCAYLHGDGHLLIVHEEKIRNVRVDYVTIHESCNVKALFEGRLVIHDRGALAMLLASKHIRCKAPSLLRGSKRTKEMGLAVGSVTFNFGHGDTWFNTLGDDVLSCDFAYQPENKDSFEANSVRGTWCDYEISKVYAEPKPEQIAA